MAIRTVIFDIDDTMYDYTFGDRAAKEAVKSYCLRELELTGDMFEHLYQSANQTIIQRIGYPCAAIHNRFIRFQCMMELMKKPLFPHARVLSELYWNTLLEQMKPQPGFKDLLKMLKERGIQIGVGTNMTAYVQYRKLECLGVEDMIDWIVTSEECGVEKPDSKFFEICAAKSGFRAAECMFIGDGLKGDALGALKSGMKPVWYTALAENTVNCPEGVIALESFEGNTLAQIIDKL